MNEHRLGGAVSLSRRLKALGEPEKITELSGGGHLTGGHWTRDILFSKDGKKLFASIGSLTNAGEDMFIISGRLNLTHLRSLRTDPPPPKGGRGIARRGSCLAGVLEGFVCLQAPGRQEGMLSRDQTMDILLLHKQGHSIWIARDTGRSHNTVPRGRARGRTAAISNPTRTLKTRSLQGLSPRAIERARALGRASDPEIRKNGF